MPAKYPRRKTTKTKKINSVSFFIAAGLVVAAIFSAFGFSAAYAAWVEPPAPPPGGQPAFGMTLKDVLTNDADASTFAGLTKIGGMVQIDSVNGLCLKNTAGTFDCRQDWQAISNIIGNTINNIGTAGTTTTVNGSLAVTENTTIGGSLSVTGPATFGVPGNQTVINGGTINTKHIFAETVTASQKVTIGNGGSICLTKSDGTLDCKSDWASIGGGGDAIYYIRSKTSTVPNCVDASWTDMGLMSYTVGWGTWYPTEWARACYKSGVAILTNKSSETGTPAACNVGAGWTDLTGVRDFWGGKERICARGAVGGSTGGVSRIIAGTGITIDHGLGDVTISSAGISGDSIFQSKSSSPWPSCPSPWVSIYSNAFYRGGSYIYETTCSNETQACRIFQSKSSSPWPSCPSPWVSIYSNAYYDGGSYIYETTCAKCN